jgi:hypothetical protein
MNGAPPTDEMCRPADEGGNLNDDVSNCLFDGLNGSLLSSRSRRRGNGRAAAACRTAGTQEVAVDQRIYDASEAVVWGHSGEMDHLAPCGSWAGGAID